MRTVFRWLPHALASEEEAIHQMRVAGRRLRIALALLALKPKGRRVRRALRVLRELTRTAGASRDLDVSFNLLEQRLTSRACHRAFLEQRPLELVRRALEVMGQARSGAISSHDAQRTAPAEPSGDGQVTFPLRNRSEGDRGATAR